MTLLMQRLSELSQLITSLPSEAYTQRSVMLGNGTIGEHVRHVVENVQCLLNDYISGCVNYDLRKRDRRIETDPTIAIVIIENYINAVVLPDKPLIIKEHNSIEGMNSSYHRELLYNAEHATHHMALIKVALREMNLDIVNENFGVTEATIRFRNQQKSIRSV